MEARYDAIQSVADEDTKISWRDRTQVSRYYSDMKKNSQESLARMAKNYRMNAASPRQVVGDDTIGDDSEIEEL